MILDSIDKLRGKKRPNIDSILDFLSKAVATIIDKDTLVDSILQLFTLKLLVNKNTPNGNDSLCLSNVGQREKGLTQETSFYKTDDNSVNLQSFLVLRRRHLKFYSKQKHPYYKMSDKFINHQRNRKHLPLKGKSLTLLQEKFESYFEKTSEIFANLC